MHSPINPTIVVMTAKSDETVLHATSAATDGFCFDLGRNCNKILIAVCSGLNCLYINS